MLHIYDDLVAGRGREGDIERIERLARGMQLGSLCELGKSAPNPVLSTLRYFRSEYEAHVRDRACPAGICRDLTAYRIDEEACDGCHACFKACPVEAISGTIKELHVIHQDVCISCGACFDACPTDAVKTFPRTELDAQKAEVV
jgi:NAD-dependent dihydropyrimidine dehydrogenase PreA subunit